MVTLVIGGSEGMTLLYFVLQPLHLCNYASPLLKYIPYITVYPPLMFVVALSFHFFWALTITACIAPKGSYLVLVRDPRLHNTTPIFIHSNVPCLVGLNVYPSRASDSDRLPKSGAWPGSRGFRFRDFLFLSFPFTRLIVFSPCTPTRRWRAAEATCGGN